MVIACTSTCEQHSCIRRWIRYSCVLINYPYDYRDSTYVVLLNATNTAVPATASTATRPPDRPACGRTSNRNRFNRPTRPTRCLVRLVGRRSLSKGPKTPPSAAPIVTRDTTLIMLTAKPFRQDAALATTAQRSAISIDSHIYCPLSASRS